MTLFALDDEACARLAERHGTPLFAYHAPSVRRAYESLRAALPERVRIAYAVKANPHPSLLRLIGELGAAFDCASIGELERFAALEVAPGRLYFAGPGKRTAELVRGLELGARFQAEGWEDLSRLDALVRSELAVNLRVHPRGGVEERNRIIGGAGPSAFGIDEEDLPEIVERARALKHVRIRGLHVFAASNERDAERLLATHAMVLELARGMQAMLDRPLEEVDLGGGLGVPYAEEETPLDLQRFGLGLRDLLAANPWFEGRLVMEPGRFLAASSGTYLARVVRVKDSRGARFLVLEGGINHLMRPLLVGQPFPARAVGRSGPTRQVTLAGPLCTSLDRLGEVDLPDCVPGDLLVFGTTGAYGSTEAMTGFLSHPPATEVWID